MGTMRFGKTGILACGMAFLLAFCMLAVAVPEAHAAGQAPTKVAKQVKAKNVTGKANVKTLFNYGYANGKQHTALKKTVKRYDITGDKKADKIKFTLKANSLGSESLAISINGKKTKIKIDGKTVSKITDNGMMGSSALVQLITVKNGRSFLYVKYTGNNMDGTYALLRYQDGKLVAAVTDNTVPAKYCTGHRYISSVKASGNKVTVVYNPMTLLAGTMYLKFTYPVKSSGALGKVATGKVYTKSNGWAGPYDNLPLTASSAFAVYTSKSLKNRSFTIYKQDEVNFQAVYMTRTKLAFKVKDAWGETGWIAAPKKAGPHFGTYFEETGLAG